MLNAYYFRHHMYTLVPRHVRDDMQWLADVGTNAVTLAVLEQDLYAAGRNIDIICREAERVGMCVHAVPSRWAGLVAGAPKVPSHFSVTHPDSWMLLQDGSPRYTGPSGVISSIHHPATLEFFRDSLTKLLTGWPIKGIVLDEVKNLFVDYHPLATARLGRDAPWERHIDAAADFFDAISAHAKSVAPGTQVSLFIYSKVDDYSVPRLAAIPHLDYFGCDGRPWGLDDKGKVEGDRKVLLGQAERFIAAARANGHGGLILIENHALADADYDLVDRRLDEVLDLGAEHVIYYYYPRDLSDPDRVMEIFARHLKARSGGRTG